MSELINKLIPIIIIVAAVILIIMVIMSWISFGMSGGNVFHRIRRAS